MRSYVYQKDAKDLLLKITIGFIDLGIPDICTLT